MIDTAKLSREEYFNPRPPWGGRRASIVRKVVFPLPFQSTPSVGRATLFAFACFPFRFISIHALRGEGDAREL